MNYVLEGFYKQAEEMGMSRIAATSFLETIEKTSAALKEYVTDAAIASGDPVGFMQKFAGELIEMEKIAISPMMDPQQLEQLQLAQQQANTAPANQVNNGMLEDFASKHPDIAPYIQKFLGGGAGNAGMGALGGGGIGALIASLTGSNPLMGLLLGGLGGGALGYFGDKFKGIGADTPAEVAAKQNNIAADTTKNLGSAQHAAATNAPSHAPGISQPASGGVADAIPNLTNPNAAIPLDKTTGFTGAGLPSEHGKALLQGGLKEPIAGPNAGHVDQAATTAANNAKINGSVIKSPNGNGLRSDAPARSISPDSNMGSTPSGNQFGHAAIHGAPLLQSGLKTPIPGMNAGKTAPEMEPYFNADLQTWKTVPKGPDLGANILKTLQGPESHPTGASLPSMNLGVTPSIKP